MIITILALTFTTEGENLSEDADNIDLGVSYDSEVSQPCKVCDDLNAVVPLKTVYIYNSTEVERASYLLEL